MNTEDLSQRKVLSFKVASFLFLHLECVMERCGQLFKGLSRRFAWISSVPGIHQCQGKV